MFRNIKRILCNQVGAIGVVTRESSIALKTEVTEGVFNPPTASTDYVEVLADGLEMNLTREELARNNLSGTVEQVASRVGVPEATGQIPVEFRASTVEGNFPQALDVAMQSLLGGRRQAVTDTTTTGNTSTVLEFGALPPFNVGDCVLVKEANNFEVRPISAVGATTITFPFALDNGAPSDGVVVAACATYFSDTANSTTFSAEHNVGNELRQNVAGMRTQNFSLENWTTGQLPTVNFAAEGLSLSRVDGAASFAPDYTADALPPVALEACLWLNGNKLSYTELGLTIENEISFINDTCLATGKQGSRITNQTVSFNASPYSDDTTLTTWDNFNSNDDVSTFFYAFNPSATAGEFSEAVAVWLPQGKFTAHPFGDQEGIVTDAVEIKAHRNLGNDSAFISFI